MEPIVLSTHVVAPSTNLRKVIAHSGYTLESAIADVIDNCVSAKAKNIDVHFEINNGEFQVSVLDDGNGMSLDKLGQAMIYAYEDSSGQRGSTDIGRYSVGLKSASSTFCKNLLVFSKVSNSEIHGVSQRFDSKDWGYDEIVCTGTEIKGKSGTLVIWNHAKLEKDDNANQILISSSDLFANLITRVKDYLSKAFGFFMQENNPLTIKVNGQRLKSWLPMNGCKGIISNFEETKEVNNSKIFVKTFILPPFKKMTSEEQNYVCLGHNGKIQDTQGFYVYRQHRLIMAGGWLGLEGLESDNKSQYARIVINFDNVLDEYMSVNFEKDSIKIPEGLSRYLLAVAKKARKDSLNTYDYKREPRPYRHRKKSDEIPVWEITRSGKTIKAEINSKNPLVNGYTSKMSEKDKKAFFSLLAKTYPISEFNGIPPAINELTKDEIENMIQKRYQELREKLDANSIAETLLKEEPFCNEKYHSLSKSLIIDLMQLEE